MTVHHHSIVEHIPAALRGVIDLASIGVVLGTLFKHLPEIAALFSIVWSAIRIAEFVREWRERRRTRK